MVLPEDGAAIALNYHSYKKFDQLLFQRWGFFAPPPNFDERLYFTFQNTNDPLDKKTLDYLIQHRDSSKVATAFNSPDNEFPEPLITIWEPRSYPVLLSFLTQGYSCPRKVLINSEVKLVDAPDTRVLTNVNSPEDLKELKFEK